MNRNQIIDLLTVAQAYDRRTVGDADVAAWSESARRKSWRFDVAADAIHEFYAETPGGWITPGHITAHHRASPAAPSARSVDEALQLSAAPASPERRAELMAEIRKLADAKAIS